MNDPFNLTVTWTRKKVLDYNETYLWMKENKMLNEVNDRKLSSDDLISVVIISKVIEFILYFHDTQLFILQFLEQLFY